MASPQLPTIRIALLGADNTTPEMVRAIAASARFELVGVCEIDSSRLPALAEAAQGQFGRIRQFSSWESLLDLQLVDAVVVARDDNEDLRGATAQADSDRRAARRRASGGRVDADLLRAGHDPSRLGRSGRALLARPAAPVDRRVTCPGGRRRRIAHWQSRAGRAPAPADAGRQTRGAGAICSRRRRHARPGRRSDPAGRNGRRTRRGQLCRLGRADVRAIGHRRPLEHRSGPWSRRRAAHRAGYARACGGGHALARLLADGTGRRRQNRDANVRVLGSADRRARRARCSTQRPARQSRLGRCVPARSNWPKPSNAA